MVMVYDNTLLIYCDSVQLSSIMCCFVGVVDVVYKVYSSERGLTQIPTDWQI